MVISWIKCYYVYILEHMHLGSSEMLTPWKNIWENANTRAQDGEHLVVLAHLWRRWTLRRRWILRDREGFGFDAFVEVNAYFPLHRKQRNRGERKSLGWPDAELDAGSDAAGASGQFNWQTRGAKCEGLWSEHSITRGTGVSDHAPRRAARREGLIGRGGASSQSRLDASSRWNCSLDPFYTQTGHHV
jgi:hypothetical protein